VHRKPRKAKPPAKTIAAAPPEPVWPPKPAAGATSTPGKSTPPPGKTAVAAPPPAKTAAVTPPPAKTASTPAPPPPAKSG